MPGSIAACAVSCRLCQVNFAGAATRSDKAETEAFQASEGLNASRIQVNISSLSLYPLAESGPFINQAALRIIEVSK
jgi:hypothetical protein